MEFYYQFIPPGNWFNNCRQILIDESWDTVRKIVRKNKSCVWCGNDNNIHAHEVFEFKKDTQILTNIIPICETCHKACHIRGTVFKNKEIPLYIEKHIKKITGKACKRKINRFIDESRKNTTKYKIDLTYINQFAKDHNVILESCYLELSKFGFYKDDYSNIKLKESKKMSLFNIYKKDPG